MQHNNNNINMLLARTNTSARQFTAGRPIPKLHTESSSSLLNNNNNNNRNNNSSRRSSKNNRNMLLSSLTLCYLMVCCGFPYAAAHLDETISVQEGKKVILPCPVNKKTCGDLHSINWFKGDDRIAVYLSDESNSTNVIEEYEDRVSVNVEPYQLIIRDLKIEDEDIFMCDTTYFIPAETCENFNGYRIKLNVLVPPSEVVVLDMNGDRIENDTIVGPLPERHTLKVSCIVRNTRPQPHVGWWRGDHRLTTYSPSYDEKNGLYTATLELVHQLTRDDLANNIECRAESSAIPSAIKYHFGVDLQVRPTSISINGVEHHTVQGSKVVLTCDIHGARPPVNVTWYNTTMSISPEENDLTEIRTRATKKEDGTYHTQSELIFHATRFENDKVFRCDAENIMLQINREKAFTSSLTLEVLYPPVVKVSPHKVVVNTNETVLLNCEYVANPASLTHVVWFLDGQMINVNDTKRYEGGNAENVALVIRSTNKNDIGNYSCQLSNVIGEGISEHTLSLDVQYVPKVQVLMMPEGPVKEDDESNVTLYCNILDANPALLTRVRWYANSSLLKELPDCDETREDLCHVDPSKLLLESIGRGFFYNYSCEGYNAAGWGTRSKERELVVHYEPGPATLTHFPMVAIKKKSVTFSCSVEEPGYPESTRFRWLRGGRGPLHDIVTREWTVEPVGLDTRTNYSCYAFNEGGKGGMATVNLDVHAPPFFIRNLPQYTGFYHSVPAANLTCRIECVPRCNITWLKDGTPIERDDNRFFVKEKYMDASPATGDFESMLSVLHFNMSNWNNGRFDILKDNYNYTCSSSDNGVGYGIKSTTCVSIEYAPENTTVSEDTVYVVENNVPGRVICKSKAIPEPKFEWFFNNKSIILSNALIINTPMTRNDSGRYTCVAKNRHGISTAETIIDVQFKPRCTLERQRLEGQDTLICTAFGNPAEASFSWSIKMENESMDWLGDGDSRNSKDKSFYVLEEDYAIARTYRCVANNTVGDGPFCEVEVAEQLAWWLRWDQTSLIILVAVILVILLAVIIICCIIICICRRRRRQEKFDADVSINTLQSVFSGESHMPQAGDTLPNADTQHSLWAATGSGDMNESLIVPQLLLAVESKATTTPINSQNVTVTTEIEQSINNNNNNNNDDATTMTRSNIVHAPKSPPRWPLRPGVMLHVRNDTKENLAVNRMTLKPETRQSSSNNTSTVSSSSGFMLTSSPIALATNNSNNLALAFNAATATLPLPGKKPEPMLIEQQSMHAEVIVPTEPETLEVKSQRRQLSKFEQRVEQFLLQLFRRAKGSSSDSTRDSQRSHVGLLGGVFGNSGIFFRMRRESIDNATATQFDAKHRLKGIRCSGSVTYKRSPMLIKSNATTTAITTTTTTKNTIISPAYNNNAQTPNTNNNNNNTNNNIINNENSSSSYNNSCVNMQQQHIMNASHSTAMTCSSQVPPAVPPLPPPPPPRPVQRSASCGSGPRSLASMIYPAHCCSTVTTMATTTITTLGRARSAPSTPKQLSTRDQTPIRSILKSRSPPPLPPPRLKQQRSVIVTPTQVGHVQIQEKSSTMGDLLTEPGEYENLPFHGLQTAPNKSNITTPTDFNNDSSHVVLVAPRPKRLTNGQIHQEHKQRQKLRPEDFDIIEQYDQIVNAEQQKHLQLQQQLQQQTNKCQLQAKNQHQYHQQQRFSQNVKTALSYNDRMMEIGVPISTTTICTSTSSTTTTTTTTPTTTYNRNAADNDIGRRIMNTHRITSNLNNCCPKSYTEYYQQQQQKLLQQQKYNANVSGLPAYAIVERQREQERVTANPTTNPFLAISNFKKFDHENANETSEQQQQQQHVEKNKSVLSFLSRQETRDSKFYTLKFPSTGKNSTTSNNNKGSCGIFRFNTSALVGERSRSAEKRAPDYVLGAPHMPAVLEKKSMKCKRHHSFTGGSIGDIEAVSQVTQRCLAFGYGLDNQTSVANLRRNASGGRLDQSAADMEDYDIDLLPAQLKAQPNALDQMPYYENLNDSVQIYECAPDTHTPVGSYSGQQHVIPSEHSSAQFATNAKSRHLTSHINGHSTTSAVLLHGQPVLKGIKKQKQHHQRQHQQKDDLNLGVMEAERLSIYRSDSGISNSSYECVTPIPGMLGMSRAHIGNTPPPHKAGKPSKHSKAGKLSKAHKPHVMDGYLEPPFHVASVLAQKHSPRQGGLQVYINSDDTDQREASPAPTLVNSSYESASSSQLDGTACGGSNSTATDPISLSSGNSMSQIASSGTLLSSRSRNCLRHQRPTELNTLEDFEQYRLGHNYAHTVSFMDSLDNTNMQNKETCIMRSANNPFLATIQNKNSTSSTNNNINSTSSADSNDKGRKKLRRQTISDPHAYIRYISSLIGNKCIPKSDAYTLAKSTATTTATITAVNDDKSQKQCQQQQQLQQISLQFQGITIYDDDVAKSSCNDNNSKWRNSTATTTRDTTNNRKIVTPWSWCNDDEQQTLETEQQEEEEKTYIKSKILLLAEKQEATIEDKLAAQIEAYNKKHHYNNNNSNNNNNNNKNNPKIWLDTYPGSRVKKITNTLQMPLPVGTTTTTHTTTTTATRMTPKIVPSLLMAQPIRTVLRKHHSFHIQPTQQIYMMQKQMPMPRVLQEDNEDETFADEQHLIKSRYNATFGGPLVYRPLTLNEKHAFKPITDAFTTTIKTEEEELQAETEEEEQKSEQSEEFAQEIKSLTLMHEGTKSKNSSNLHPAASLEMLEALTQSNPELIYATTQPGSRRNLHQQLSALQQQQTTYTTSDCCMAANELRAKLHAKLSCSDAQQRKFYFGDEQNILLSHSNTLQTEQIDEIAAANEDQATTAVDSESDISPNCTVILAAQNTDGAAQVKYLVRQNCREIHI